MNITRRHSLATLAVLAIAAGLPANAVAGGSYQGNQGHKHRRPASDQITPVSVFPASRISTRCNVTRTSRRTRPSRIRKAPACRSNRVPDEPMARGRTVTG